MELDPVGEDAVDVVECERPPRVAGHLHLLDRRERPAALFLQTRELRSELPELSGDVRPSLLGEIEQALDLHLEPDYGPLEFDVRLGGQPVLLKNESKRGERSPMARSPGRARSF